MLTEYRVACPYCGEQFKALVDYSEGEQEYIEDCQVCCRPITFRLDVDYGGNLISVQTLREDEI